MITAAVLGALAHLAGWVVGLLPGASSTAGATGSFSNAFVTLLADAASMDSWIPWEVIPIMLLIFGTTWGTSLLVTIIRRVVSHFTGGGGAL